MIEVLHLYICDGCGRKAGPFENGDEPPGWVHFDGLTAVCSETCRGKAKAEWIAKRIQAATERYQREADQEFGRDTGGGND